MGNYFNLLGQLLSLLRTSFRTSYKCPGYTQRFLQSLFLFKVQSLRFKVLRFSQRSQIAVATLNIKPETLN
jgi:hypothetical protein